MKVTVVIPTHDRPRFLKEAVASVVAQSHADWELVIVDDGSQPAVDAALLGSATAGRLVFIRHAQPLGVARAKNAGIAAATGELITILDDDDLLASGTLQALCEAFERHPWLDCIFLGVEPFGPYASGVAQNRRAAIERLLKLATPNADDKLWFFDQRLFAALVSAVPIDFQRPAARRGTWNIVGGFDESALFSESAWAIRACAVCHLALSRTTQNLWRIHDSNFGWQGEQGGKETHEARLRQIENTVGSSKSLVKQFGREHKLSRRRLKILKSGLSDNLFDKAYFLRNVRSPEGVQALVQSMLLRPRWKHVRLMLRYVLRFGGSS